MSFNKRKRFRPSLKVVITVLVVALLIGYVIFEITLNQGSTPFRINFIVPWGLIAIVISFYFFGENNRIRSAKRDNRREHINQRKEELLENLRKKTKNDIAELKNKTSDNNNE